MRSSAGIAVLLVAALGLLWLTTDFSADSPDQAPDGVLDPANRTEAADTPGLIGRDQAPTGDAARRWPPGEDVIRVRVLDADGMPCTDVPVLLSARRRAPPAESVPQRSAFGAARAWTTRGRMRSTNGAAATTRASSPSRGWTTVGTTA